ncbi:MAG: hypothetical protein IJU81_06240 [Bacteroidales bacterium]|nr:hypothetical protein [Bacteroidales bacterium]
MKSEAFCKKSVMTALFLVAFAGLLPWSLMAQTVSPETVKQYRQMVSMCNGAQPPSFDACRSQLEQYGFVYNANNAIDIFTVRMHPFYRAEGHDSVGCMLSVFDDKVYTVGGVFTSLDAGRVFPLVAKASEMQAQLASQLGCTKYVGSVKGKVKKVATKPEELRAVLEGVEAEMVSMIYESWKSEDGTRMITLIYDNDRYGKKAPKDKDRVKLSLSVGTTPKQ